MQTFLCYRLPKNHSGLKNKLILSPLIVQSKDESGWHSFLLFCSACECPEDGQAVYLSPTGKGEYVCQKRQCSYFCTQILSLYAHIINNWGSYYYHHYEHQLTSLLFNRLLSNLISIHTIITTITITIRQPHQDVLIDISLHTPRGFLW